MAPVSLTIMTCMQLLHMLEGRRLEYELCLSNTRFDVDGYQLMMLAILRTTCARRIELRACRDASKGRATNSAESSPLVDTSEALVLLRHKAKQLLGLHMSKGVAANECFLDDQVASVVPQVLRNRQNETLSLRDVRKSFADPIIQHWIKPMQVS